MGYSTDFAGELEFVNELTVPQLLKIDTFLGEDCRNHSEWETKPFVNLVDLELSSGYTGLKWNGAEKTCDLVDIVNMITTNMRKEFPDFSLKGEMLAQGEESDDQWKLIIGDDGMAYKKMIN